MRSGSRFRVSETIQVRTNSFANIDHVEVWLEWWTTSPTNNLGFRIGIFILLAVIATASHFAYLWSVDLALYGSASYADETGLHLSHSCPQERVDCIVSCLMQCLGKGERLRDPEVLVVVDY